MEATLSGIQEVARQVLVEQSRRTGEDVPVGGAWKQPEIDLCRGKVPINDYEDGPRALYDGFWDLFPTRSGLGSGTLRKGTYRRLFLYHDNRAAGDVPLLFCCASTIQRHATNSSVKARVRTNQARFDEFNAEVNVPGFWLTMQKVKANPTAKKSLAWLRKQNRFLQMNASRVPSVVGRRRLTAVEDIVAGALG